MLMEDIVDMQRVNSNSSQVSKHNQVAATSANGLSRFTADFTVYMRGTAQKH